MRDCIVRTTRQIHRERHIRLAAPNGSISSGYMFRARTVANQQIPNTLLSMCTPRHFRQDMRPSAVVSLAPHL